MFSNAVNWLFRKSPSLEEKILKRLNKDSIEHAFENSSEDEESEQQQNTFEHKPHCVERKGLITKIGTNAGIIDGKYSFDIGLNTVANLEVGQNVQYLCYVKENKEIIVTKILSIQNETWEKDGDVQEEVHEIDEDGAKFSVHKRSIITRVAAKLGRSVLLADVPVSCNLDKVKSTFMPEIGDVVLVEAVVQTDGNELDFAGEVLELLSLNPHMKSCKEGVITSYDNDNNRGVIDKEILFMKDVCENGYSPMEGDKVMVESIECDQLNFNLRAVNVVPISLKPNNDPENKMDQLIKQMLMPKNGVVIRPAKFSAKEIGDQGEIFIEVSNNGSQRQQITNLVFRKSFDPQLVLAGVRTPKDLYPSQSQRFKVFCTAKYTGYSKEMIIVTFRNNFKVAKYIDIDVDLDTEISKGSSKKNSMSTMYQNAAKLRSSMINFKTVIPGEQLIKNPSFVHKALGMYYIPDRLYKGVTGKGKQSFDSISQVIIDMEPILQSDVSFESYLPRFRVLLYLEDIDSQLAISQYNLQRGHFTHCQGYLSLEIPNLSERRPSLMSGDSLLAIDIENPNAVKYQGFIHKVQANSIWLKFNPQFHEKYNGRDYILEFHTTRTSIRRCQQAIEMAVENLGRRILFASQCAPKDPQLEITMEGEDMVLKEAQIEIADIAPRRRFLSSIENGDDIFTSIENGKKSFTKIEWINPDMNLLQKTTVKNILRGDARPLPYIIFGPPGTGKTITVVETVMQILKLIPNSRILLATPSNSSSNLLTQRLIGLGLKPGEMVRVLAHHLIESGMVPEDIQPYCSTVDLAREGTRESRFKTMETGLRLHSTRTQLSRYRLIISTCMTLGQLHTMGLKRGHFTHVIVDEAGQATEPEIMVPMTHTHVDKGQIVLAGDPMQLGPIVGSKFAAHFGLEESYLSRLMLRFPYQKDPEGFKDTGGYNPHLVTKLVNNYRSLPEILKLPSDMFYDSDLIPEKVLKESADEKLLNLLADILPKRDKKLGPPPIVFHGIQGRNVQSDDSPSWYNKAEAGQILDFMSKLIAKGIDCESAVGIITPYQKQVQVIRGTLGEMNVPVPKIGSVEEFQGQERSIILISTVRSSKSKVVQDLQHTLGFVRNPKRLNVAITRAKTLLVIFGNPSLLSLDNNWNRLISYCVSIGGYTGCELPSIYWKEEDFN